jgi:purine-nucleoside phosphorylase
LHDGIYAGLMGPAYESPAEAKLWRSMGADAVGMSTVLETIAARALGLSVVGFSLIANVHLTGDVATHAAVIAASQRGASDIARLIEGIVANLDTPLPATPEPTPATASEESVLAKQPG